MCECKNVVGVWVLVEGDEEEYCSEHERLDISLHILNHLS